MILVGVGKVLDVLQRCYFECASHGQQEGLFMQKNSLNPRVEWPFVLSKVE